MRRSILATALLTTVAFAGCASGNSSQAGVGMPMVPGQQQPAKRASGSNGEIQHVVIMIQENRSYDDFFATFPGANGTTYGCMEGTTTALRPRPRPASSGSSCPAGDTLVPLKESSLATDSLGHQYFSYRKEYDNGLMDGFNKVERALRRGVKEPAGTYAYRYVDPKDIQPYWDLAKDWVLADDAFSTQGSSSFTAHQDFIAGGTPVDGDNVIDFPIPSSWGCKNSKPGTVTSLITYTGVYKRGKGPFPCFDYETIRDLLDNAGVSWLYFTNPSQDDALWNGFAAIKAVREGSEWGTHIIAPETDIFQYISNGELPAVSYVIPDAQTSDHPGPHVDKGPEWIASVVNAIGESSYWPSTLIIVVWDEWGGNYDHVPPPQLDGQGLGPRIPMLLISAYDKETTASTPGYVSHTQYEDGSVLKFMEENWNLCSSGTSGCLGTSDKRAKSIADSFDFSQPARAYIPVSSSLSIDYFEHRFKPSSDPIDDY
jgi:phospholipase C